MILGALGMKKTANTEEGETELDLREIIDEQFNEAITHYNEGRSDAALEICKKLIDIDGVDARNAARISKLLGQLGQTAAAAQIREMVLAGLSNEAAKRPQDASIQSEAGFLHEYFEETDVAVGYYNKALDLDPSDLMPAFQLTGMSLRRGDPRAAIQIWEPVIAKALHPGKVLLRLARILGQSGFPSEAEEILERARPHCSSIMKEFDFVVAGVRGESKSLDQHGMAVELFDAFADSYDQTLESLQNNGPYMIGQMLDDLGLKKDGSRKVLDAGCGTGLCAEYLRPFASQVAGADISAKMLKICLDKRVYDTLTRTDLAEPVTYPEGSFDLIVAADVLVYFGDLRDVFSNIASKLSPGGWFVFTVEKALPPEPSVGYRLRATGRHVHVLDYLDGVLTEAGFGRSKRHFEDSIRNELGEPVVGYAVAAQKPALSIFA